MAFDPITSALIIDKGVGIPPNDMQSFSAISNDSGIKLTFTGPANSYMDKGGTNETLLCTPSGVLVCYSETGYPEDVSEGTVVGLFNEDYDPESPQQFEYDVVGLTFGNTYYFTAFPVSVEGVYNKSKSANNRSTCKWEGTKGTLTVTVTQDYGYQTLGEYTVTMTPTAGGEAIVKTQSGEATIVFSNLDDGEYTLSFSDVINFTKPSEQKVTAVGGQSETIQCQFLFSPVLENCTWAQIQDYTKKGLSEKFFNVGDRKTIKVRKITGGDESSCSSTYSLGEEMTVNAILVHFNYETGTFYNNGKNLAFVTEGLPVNAIIYAGEYSCYGYNESFWQFLQDNASSILPDVYDVLTEKINVMTFKPSASGPGHETTNGVISSSNIQTNTPYKLVVPSISSLGGFSSISWASPSTQEESAYSYFTTNERRKEIGKGTKYVSRSSLAQDKYVSLSTTRYIPVSTDGSVASSYNSCVLTTNRINAPLAFYVG